MRSPNRYMKFSNRFNAFKPTHAHREENPYLISVISFSVLLFELVLTRILGYFYFSQFIPLAVSAALFGLGLGAFLFFRYTEPHIPQVTDQLFANFRLDRTLRHLGAFQFFIRSSLSLHLRPQ